MRSLSTFFGIRILLTLLTLLTFLALLSVQRPILLQISKASISFSTQSMICEMYVSTRESQMEPYGAGILSQSSSQSSIILSLVVWESMSFSTYLTSCWQVSQTMSFLAPFGIRIFKASVQRPIFLQISKASISCSIQSMICEIYVSTRESQMAPYGAGILLQSSSQSSMILSLVVCESIRDST